MKQVKDIPEKELKKIRYLIGDAFVTNELFHELGTVEERRRDVLAYMAAYVDYVCESGALYCSDDGKAYIGLLESKDPPVLPMLKMLIRIILRLPFGKLNKMLHHINQIANANEQYAKHPHIDVLMLAIDKSEQGKGRARELFDFAISMSEEKQLPLLIDTDMEDYARMYQHFGCTLYNTKTADNGVTRYDLIWK